MRFLTLLAAALLALPTLGCAASRTRATAQPAVLTVSLGDDMIDPATGSVPSVEIDIFAPSADEAAQWRTVSVTDYFARAGSRRAADDRVTFAFTGTDTAPRSMADTDALWSAWRARGATELVLLANFPPGARDRHADEDPRRLILPLEGRWADADIRIELWRTGLLCRTPIAPRR